MCRIPKNRQEEHIFLSTAEISNDKKMLQISENRRHVPVNYIDAMMILPSPRYIYWAPKRNRH